MTDKIMIDGVDVSGCEFLQQEDIDHDYTCYAEEGYQSGEISCSVCPSYYYKQLKRLQNQYNAVVEQNKSLQQEVQRKEGQLKVSQHYNVELAKYILNIGELFNLTQTTTINGKNCIEYYAILSSSIGNQIKELQADSRNQKNINKH